MRALFALFALLAALALTLLASPASAHGARTVSVDITEASPGRAILELRGTAPGDAILPEVAAPCATAPADPEDAPAGAALLTCPGSIAGARLTVGGLGPIIGEAIVLVRFHDGRTASRLVTAAEPSLVLPEAQGALDIARSYVGLGVKHILTGYDHLLFLVLLVLLLRRPRAILLAESAFTLSHSLSFSATALGLIHAPAAAAEACIALSLVLLALDLGRAERPSSARGAAAAFVFGLVHGLGFAGGLSEIGLPDHDVALALLGFAGGVEVGQIAFLALALLTLGWAARKPRLARLEPAAILLSGGVATYWLLDRLLA